METQDTIAIGSLIIAFVSVLTSFILQRDEKKLRNLEFDNKKYKQKLFKAIRAIQGYQIIEEECAAHDSIAV
ncbi:MAG TPA: hypothetical protein PKA63_01425 [Oligoflexia bacterium]|mgnify:CR=1 FL=1|nr:hypothetical protein [Oligoflexia bacterium]HMP47309.1 hypothetical protein [Oligoflexia bacterium]